MIKWLKGFLTGIFLVAFVISLGLAVFYKELIEDIRKRPRKHYVDYYTASNKERG